MPALLTPSLRKPDLRQPDLRQSMTVAFNITLIVPDNYPHSWALSEVAEYLAYFIKCCGYTAELSTNFISADHRNVVLCGHMLSPQSFETMPADTILFNSEQLDDREGWQFKSGVYRAALERFHVWDYCEANLRKIGHDRKTVIPLLFCERLVRKTPARKSGDTLVFCGAWNERRAAILHRLNAAGVKSQFLSNLYGPERDQVMFNAWAVLNLHKQEDLDVFEPVRCFYPLANGVPVISEAYDPEPQFAAYRDCMFTFPKDDFCDAVTGLYRDRARFRREAKRQLAAFRATDALPALRAAVAAYRDAVPVAT